MVFDGRYKLIEGYDPHHGTYDLSSGDLEQVEAYFRTDRRMEDVRRDREPILFDLDRDPNEIENVAGDHPDVVRALSKQLLPEESGHEDSS